ncbi:hypothetical protein [Chitinolyticbacter albus]|uniref:hypothetical protein n=1 Tax=Chitinolyticbacter albus TaxID=2961951 RepID=UPI00210AC5F5|nr:hypothetical protein [Chitinolyticbacter albus]
MSGTVTVSLPPGFVIFNVYAPYDLSATSYAGNDIYVSATSYSAGTYSENLMISATNQSGRYLDKQYRVNYTAQNIGPSIVSGGNSSAPVKQEIAAPQKDVSQELHQLQIRRWK